MILKLSQVYAPVLLVNGRRPGRRGFGVPAGGAFDRESMALANSLLGNPLVAPVLEVALGTVSLEADDAVTLACVGAGASQSTIHLSEGQRFTIGPATAGARFYLAAPGGISTADQPNVFTCDGGLRPVQSLVNLPNSLSRRPLRVTPGPESGELGIDWLLQGAFEMSPLSNRVGLRLVGTSCPHALELPSEPQTIGVVQTPPSGEPIILGPDGPTIGGYPKVAVVIDADIDRLAQLAPGDPVAFELVDGETARRLSSDHREFLRRFEPRSSE